MRTTVFRAVIAGAMLAVATMAGCRSDGLRPEQRAARKATLEIMHTIAEGRTDDLVSMVAYSDSLGEAYQTSIKYLLTEYLANSRNHRGGIVSYDITGDTVLGSAAQVFVQLHYADSTTEEIDIPLTLVGGEWKLR